MARTKVYVSRMGATRFPVRNDKILEEYSKGEPQGTMIVSPDFSATFWLGSFPLITSL